MIGIRSVVNSITKTPELDLSHRTEVSTIHTNAHRHAHLIPRCPISIRNINDILNSWRAIDPENGLNTERLGHELLVRSTSTIPDLELGSVSSGTVRNIETLGAIVGRYLARDTGSRENEGSVFGGSVGSAATVVNDDGSAVRVGGGGEAEVSRSGWL